MDKVLDLNLVLDAIARAATLAKDGPQDIRAEKFVLHDRRAPLPDNLKKTAEAKRAAKAS